MTAFVKDPLLKPSTSSSYVFAPTAASPLIKSAVLNINVAAPGTTESVALTGTILAVVTGQPLFDGIASIAIGLLLPDSLQFILRFGFSHEIIDTGFSSDGSSCQRIISRNHHSPDTHFAEFGKPLFDTSFYNVFQVYDSKDVVIFSHRLFLSKTMIRRFRRFRRLAQTQLHPGKSAQSAQSA